MSAFPASICPPRSAASRSSSTTRGVSATPGSFVPVGSSTVLAEPADGATLAAHVHALLGVTVDIIVDGSFVAVVAEREGDAVLAAEAVAAQLRWREPPGKQAASADPDEMVAAVESSMHVINGTSTDEDPGPARTHPSASTVVAARYTKPFLLHGSIGPSCAVARFDGSRLDISTHSQGVELWPRRSPRRSIFPSRR